MDFIFFLNTLFNTVFNCRPSDSSLPEDAGIEPRTGRNRMRRNARTASGYFEIAVYARILGGRLKVMRTAARVALRDLAMEYM